MSDLFTLSVHTGHRKNVQKSITSTINADVIILFVF